jgi:hypothetical protein
VSSSHPWSRLARLSGAQKAKLDLYIQKKEYNDMYDHDRRDLASSSETIVKGKQEDFR